MAHADDSAVAEAVRTSLEGRYVQRHVVGRGGYGEVWLLDRVADSKKCVAKIMAHAKKHRFDSEVACLAKCHHFGIVRLMDEPVDSKLGPIMILEYADGGDLQHFIKKHADVRKAISEELIGIILVQMVFALHYIHSHRMLHRDIKSANVLLCSNNLVKMTDFGFSKCYDSSVSMEVAETKLGTPYYLAPELWRGVKYSKKADMFSLGVVLYELMMLDRPFRAPTVPGLMHAVLAGDYIKPDRSQFHEDLIRLLEDLLHVDPNKRPSTREIIVNYPCFQKYVAAFLKMIAHSSRFTDDEKAQMEKDVRDQTELARKQSALRDSSTPSASSMGSGGSPSQSPSHGSPDRDSVTSPHDNEEHHSQIEGYVEMASGPEWKHRYATLVADKMQLLVSRVKDDKKSAALDLNLVTSLSLAETDAGFFAFVLILNQNQTVTFRVGKEEERTAWLEALTAATKTVVTVGGAQ